MHGRLTLIALVGALALAGCGSSDKADSTSTPAATTAAATTPADTATGAKSSPDADKAAAIDALNDATGTIDDQQKKFVAQLKIAIQAKGALTTVTNPARAFRGDLADFDAAIRAIEFPTVAAAVANVVLKQSAAALAALDELAGATSDESAGTALNTVNAKYAGLVSSVHSLQQALAK